MTTATKRKGVSVVILILMVWPLAHRYLVSEYRVSPWRFFGWAMYCTPKLDTDVNAYSIEERVRKRLRLNRNELKLAQEAARQFEKDRRVWGRLVEPEHVAIAIFEALPTTQAILLKVEQEYLNPETACIDAWIDRYHYERDQFELDR